MSRNITLLSNAKFFFYPNEEAYKMFFWLKQTNRIHPDFPSLQLHEYIDKNGYYTLTPFLGIAMLFFSLPLAEALCYPKLIFFSRFPETSNVSPP